jgi:Xaa-Pro aminopeptidase
MYAANIATHKNTRMNTAPNLANKLPAELFVLNREMLASKMQDNSLAVLWAADEMPRNGDIAYPYRQSSDFYYLTGIEQEQSALLILKLNGIAEVSLFIREADPLLVTWEGPKLSAAAATEISGIKNVSHISSFDGSLAAAAFKAGSIYLNSNENPRAHFAVGCADERNGRKVADKYYLHAKLRLAPLLCQCRLVKSSQELSAMRNACRLTGDAFAQVAMHTRQGMAEAEIEAIIIKEFTKKGASHAFSPIVASGSNSCYLHYTGKSGILEPNGTLFLDFGAEVSNYSSDMSRYLPVGPKFSPRQSCVYQAVHRVFLIARQLMVPGATIAAIQEETCLAIDQELIGLGLYSKAQSAESISAGQPLYKKYFMHGVSHFMGLDTHDVGSKDIPLQAGMVLSCEPGIYIPEEGIGIRLENTICVGSASPDDFMEHVPIDIADIENLRKHA